jgi:hypothetical protein
VRRWLRAAAGGRVWGEGAVDNGAREMAWGRHMEVKAQENWR